MSTIIVLSILYSCMGKSSTDGGMKDFQALALCQEQIKSASLDRASAEVPYVENMGTGGEFYFAWGAQTKPARLRNGAGLDATASASCIVNRATGQVTQLTLNGITIR